MGKVDYCNLPGEASGDSLDEFSFLRTVPLDFVWDVVYLELEDTARPVSEFQIEVLLW